MAEVTFTPVTERTIASLPVLEQRLAEIRDREYGEDEGEYTPGVDCVAVPVRGQNGPVIAATSGSIPSARIDSKAAQRDRLLRSRQKHAAALSRDLAGPRSSPP